MTYIIKDAQVGHQAIADTSTTQNHPLGTIVNAVDATRGEGEFIYLQGVAGTVVGSWVTYAADDYSTALLTANAAGPVAVAMSANVAGPNYGWYQISGKAVALADDVSDDARVFIDTDTDGRCDDAFIAGDQVWGARWASDDDTSSTSADVEIARPFVNDGEDNDTN